MEEYQKYYAITGYQLHGNKHFPIVEEQFVVATSFNEAEKKFKALGINFVQVSVVK